MDLYLLKTQPMFKNEHCFMLLVGLGGFKFFSLLQNVSHVEQKSSRDYTTQLVSLLNLAGSPNGERNSDRCSVFHAHRRANRYHFMSHADLSFME